MSTIDAVKRRRVMQRSQKLGHCICDPRKPCPCDTFQGQGICPCAGERPAPLDLASVKLTQLVHNAGCASKIAPGDLEAVLSRLPAVTDPAVVSGIACADDAGIYKLSDDIHLVQTVDVMTPCCDDPYMFGRICAVNCLSDIYAMGGVPRTALSVLAFPSETLDGRIMYEMLRGSMEVLTEAGVALIGGHSIKDNEIKLGFAITGTVEAAKLTLHDTAREGDLLVLTKPLGAGVLNFASQIGRSYGDIDQVVKSMATLNRSAALAAAEVNVSACTDVTGFGLFGHLISMARHSEVTMEVWADALPAFDGAIEGIRDGVVPGAVERNTEYVGEDIAIHDDVDKSQATLGFDAQTSGGLLLCVLPADCGALLAALERRGVRGWVIGRVSQTGEGRIVVVNQPPDDGGRNIAGKDIRMSEHSQDKCCGGESRPQGSQSCCDTAAAGKTNSPAMAEAFAALMKATAGDGAIDAKTKELITFALVVMSRCGPCVEHHIKKARQMGITQEQLDEAAWCATAIGGAPVRMFYLEAMAGKGGQSHCC